MNEAREPQPGELWTVDFGVPLGHEQGLRRPALILSDQRLSSFELAIVCPVTRTRHGWPVHVEIEPGISGLGTTSYIQAEQIRTISHKRLVARLGTIDPVDFLRVQRLISTLLDIPPAPRGF